MAETPWGTTAATDLSALSTGFGIASALQQGGARADVSAATSAAKLGSNLGAFGTASKAIGGAAADVANIANIYTGLQQGGVTGYGGAAINTAALGARLGAFGGASSSIGAAAAPFASALSLYNFAEQWQSGKTGADALAGAQAGATIGAEFGVVGAIPGALLGAAVGALSSAFGGGAQDPEHLGWNQYAATYQKGGAAAVTGASPATNWQMLSGVFDSRGSSIPFFNKFGRMGENRFMLSMTGQINSALAAGTINASDSASPIYQKVVDPWINSMSPRGWKEGYTIKGAPEKAAIQTMLTGLIGQWQSGQLTSQSKVGMEGQTISGLQSFGGQGVNPQAQQTAQMGQQMMQPLSAAVDTFPLGAGRQARIA